MEPRRRSPREQRLGCGRSAGGRGGGSAERGPREASCESGGSRRLRPRSPGCCVGEAAPGSRYSGGSGPRPAVGRAGREVGGRGRAGAGWGATGTSGRVNKARCARARGGVRPGLGDWRCRARPRRSGCGSWESRGLGRVPRSIGKSQAGGGGSAHAGRPSGKLDQLRCGPLGRAADRLPEAAGSVQLRAEG